jgi:hypothetical protein
MKKKKRRETSLNEAEMEGGGGKDLDLLSEFG